MEIKAIETEYKGYRFRSRLEARWAVFFDSAEIPWEYEKEGYELSTGEKYLPDFYLPKDDIFVEVKGQQPSEKDIGKLEQLAYEIKKSVLLVVGILGEGECSVFCYDSKENEFVWLYVDLCPEPFVNKFLEVTRNPLLLFIIDENTSRYKKLHREVPLPLNTISKDMKSPYLFSLHVEIQVVQEKLIEAMKQARFEYGETPLLTKRKRKGKKQIQSKEKISPIMPIKEPAYYEAERILLAHIFNNLNFLNKLSELMQGNTLVVDEHQAILTYLYGFHENDNTDIRDFLGYVDDVKLRSVIANIETLANRDDKQISEIEFNMCVDTVLSAKKGL